MSDLSPNILSDITSINFRSGTNPNYTINSRVTSSVTYNVATESTSSGVKRINIGTGTVPGGRTRIFLAQPAQTGSDSRVYIAVPSDYAGELPGGDVGGALNNDTGAAFQLAATGVSLAISREDFATLRLNDASVESPGGQTESKNMIIFKKNGFDIGSVSHFNGTVSYNPFLGSHWGRLEDNSNIDIPVGTILETVDKLIEWKIYSIDVDGTKKTFPYNGDLETGETIEIEYEGKTYSTIIENEKDYESTDLNKHVCVKINDTPSSSKVFGVFCGWDNGALSEDVSYGWNDIICGAVGNFFIRMASGQDPQIGDLVESDGKGCGIVQSDDIVRSKTVAKVTSTIRQKVYDDGSFLVTCVLMCG